MLFNPNSKILFQGDSITDTGRNREITQPNIGNALASIPSPPVIACWPIVGSNRQAHWGD